MRSDARLQSADVSKPVSYSSVRKLSEFGDGLTFANPADDGARGAVRELLMKPSHTRSAPDAPVNPVGALLS